MKSNFLNGINVFCPENPSSLVNFIIDKKKILVAINAEKILHSNEKVKKIINSNIGYPDGMGAVMGLRKKGLNKAIKIPGCKFWLELISECYMKKTFYLIGSKQNVIEQTVKQLKKQFHSINILNYRNGYLKSKKDKDDLIDDIKLRKPDVIFVATGSPNQEYLMYELQKNYKAIYLGLGGSFDAYIGNVKLAPKFWIDYNLEWLFRLIQEPKRIKRQVHLVRFMILLYFNKL